MFIKNQRLLIIGVVVCLILAGTIYYFNNFKIPRAVRNVEAEVRQDVDDKAMPKRTVAVVANEDGISKYTELTEKLLKEKIKLVEIPEKYVVKGAVTDISKIEGKITREDLRFGEQVVLESTTEDRKWYGEYHRLKEYKVSSIVANEVKTGNIIDVLVNYGNGDYDVVLSKIKVIKLISPPKQPAADRVDKSSVEAQTDNTMNLSTAPETGDGYTMIFALNEEQYRDMELAKDLGKLETRLYIDEGQPPSKTTFNYAEMADRHKLSEINTKSEVTTVR